LDRQFSPNATFLRETIEGEQMMDRIRRAAVVAITVVATCALTASLAGAHAGARDTAGQASAKGAKHKTRGKCARAKHHARSSGRKARGKCAKTKKKARKRSRVLRGPVGPPGPPGTRVVARIRGAGPKPTAHGDGVDYPLTPSGWTQPVGETEELLGELALVFPRTCDEEPSEPAPTSPVDDLLGTGEESFVEPPGVFIELKVDGKEAGGVFDTFDPQRAGKTEKMPLYFESFFEPETPVPHTITAKISDSCNGADQHFTVANIRVNVFGTS
jgi:hypothetical protein